MLPPDIEVGARMHRIKIDTSTAPPYEGGAALLSALAWPEMLADPDAIGRRQAALCQIYLRARAEVDEVWASTPQLIKPLHMLRPWKEVQAFDRDLQKRLRVRMAAARMVLPFLIEAEGSGVTPKWPKGSISLNRMAERVIGDTAESEVSNVKTRVWRTSRPVIHIAAAVDVAIRHAEASKRTVTVADLLQDAAVIRWVAEVSQQFAAVLPGIPRLNLRADELVTLSLD